jgi:hypothetical protein
MSIQLNGVTVTGGANLGTDQVVGAPNIDYQLVKLGFSVSGVTPTQVSSGNPLPVTVNNALVGQQDNAPFTEGTSVGLAIMAMGNDTAPGSVTEGDAGIPRMSLDRHLRTVAVEETGFVKSLGLNLAVNYANIEAASNGNNTIVAAVGGKRIRVLCMDMMASAAVNGKFTDGAGGADLTGLAYMNIGGGLVRPYTPHGWFQTSAGNALVLNLSAATAVGGCITYLLV